MRLESGLLSGRILSLKWGMRAQRPVEKVGSHFPITWKMTTDLVSKYVRRTMHATSTPVLSLAHGLPNGWIALTLKLILDRLGWVQYDIFKIKLKKS